MVKKKIEEDEEQEEQPKKKEVWKVGLVITDEEKPPKKVLQKGERTLDNWAAQAEILNELEQIRKALLS